MTLFLEVVVGGNSEDTVEETVLLLTESAPFAPFSGSASGARDDRGLASTAI